MIHFFQIFTFATVMAVAPSPANILSASYGKRSGLMNSLGFIVGASLGFLTLSALISMYLIDSIYDYPHLVDFLRYISSFYIIIISLRWLLIGELKNIPSGINSKLLNGFIIQWINPKCWGNSLLIASNFGNSDISFLSVISITFVVELISLTVWAYMGEQISKVLSSREQQNFLNCIIVISLVASIVSMWF